MRRRAAGDDWDRHLVGAVLLARRQTADDAAQLAVHAVTIEAVS